VAAGGVSCCAQNSSLKRWWRTASGVPGVGEINRKLGMAQAIAHPGAHEPRVTHDDTTDNLY
jgi:hypothetical protein